MGRSIFLPRRSTLLLALSVLLLIRRARPLSTLLTQPSQTGLLLLLLANWRSFPLVWHIKLWSLVPWIRYRIARYGVETEGVCSVAKSPFERKVTQKGVVSLDRADWNGHMSNTSYGVALDSARFKWLLEVVGPAMGPIEQIWSPLGGTAFTFFKEIPLGATYTIEMSIVSWDDKWIYYAAHFTTLTSKGLKTLHCTALSRSCFKLRTTRLSIPPARVLSLSGLGPTRENWQRTLSLRAQGKSKKWLEFGGRMVVEKKKGEGERRRNGELGGEKGWEEDGMSTYEEMRVERLGRVVKVLGESEDWRDL